MPGAESGRRDACLRHAWRRPRASARRGSRPCAGSRSRAGPCSDIPARARAYANGGAPDRRRPIHSEAEAKARCPTDTVVWVNTKSHIYHYAGTRSYGTTKQGAYMCQADANAAGDRASKSRIGQPKEPQT